jgi:arylsulfatase A-like enzyme
MPQRSALVAVATIVATLAVCAPGCHEGPPAFDHVVLISLDTLRADHLGCYGNKRIETPRIDALASEGILFEQHIAVAPTTLPSHTSLMTGLYPRSHGTPRNGFVVGDDLSLLAEVLREAGFATAGFVAAIPLAARFGFAQGFDHYDEPERRLLRGDSDPALRRRAAWMTDSVLAWLDERPRGADDRLFLFVHYFDVHYPYVNGEPWDSMYRAPDMPALSGSMRDLDRLRLAFRRDDPAARALSAARAAAYAGGVSYTDLHVGRLLDGLAERGLLERSLVVLTSDHGETMHDHPAELWDHGATVFDDSMRVPLVLRLPGAWRAGTRVPALVANIDVAPTLLDLLGLPPLAAAEGRSFRGLLEGRPMPEREPVFLEANKPQSPDFEAGTAWRNERKLRAVRSAHWKLLERPRRAQRQLFDLVLDPREIAPLEVDAQHALLGEALDAWAGAPTRAEQPAPLDPATTRRLEELGYGADAN